MSDRERRADSFLDQKNIDNANKLRDTLPLAAFVRMKVLEYIDEHPMRSIPEVDDSILDMMPELRPEALVYTVPISGAKIVANEDDGAWKGIAFHPHKTKSTFAWHSENLNLGSWAKTPHVLRAFLFITSRIDDDGLSHFQIPNTKFLISAAWNEEERRFGRGTIVDTSSKRQQEWRRSGWFSTMDQGHFNYNANIRRMQNLICRVMTVADGGLKPNVPT